MAYEGVAHSITKHIQNEWSAIWFKLMYSHKDQIDDFFDAISNNPNLSMNIVNTFCNEKWNWEKNSDNWAFDLYDVKCNLDLPWKFEKNGKYIFALNKDLLQTKPLKYWIEVDRLFTFDMIRKYPDLPWKCDKVTKLSTPNDINNNPNYPWNWNIMHANMKITKEFVLQHKDKTWDWNGLSSHPVISIDLLWNLPDKKWNWDLIGKNPSITIAEIQHYKLLPWNYKTVFFHPHITTKITEEFIAEYPHTQNYSSCVCDLMNAIIQYPEINWNWNGVSENYNKLTLDFIVAHPEKPWNYQKLMTKINNIQPSDIKKYPTLPWDYSLLSHAPQFFNTVSQLQNENWNWNLIVLQTFDYDRGTYIEMHVKFVLIASIYDNYEEIRKMIDKPDSHAESVFLDNYLLQLVAKF